MARRIQFGVDEWYHCFNRGVDKRDVFESERDANRFLTLLYLANGNQAIQLFHNDKSSLRKAFSVDRGEPLVSIGAYCLMKNHYHLLLKEVVEGGITSFMRKLGTAYTMYFNARNERAGHLFSGPFRARHVGDDRYFQKVLQYIHCNPAELYEKGWKFGDIKNIRALESKLVEYPYSSLKNYWKRTISNPILSSDGFEIAVQPSVAKMLEEARSYYRDLRTDEV